MASEYTYVIHCFDDLSVGMVDNGTRFGGSSLRIGNYTEHKEWQAITNDPTSAHYIKKICAGPLESEDGKFMIGSCIIVQATREKVDAFVQQDPFFIKKVWKDISITRYIAPNGIKAMTAEMENDDRSTLHMAFN